MRVPNENRAGVLKGQTSKDLEGCVEMLSTRLGGPAGMHVRLLSVCVCDKSNTEPA